MKQQKYLFVVGQLQNGGLERQLYYICKQLKERAIDTTVVCWNCHPDDYYYSSFSSLLGSSFFGLSAKENKIKKVKSLREIIQRGKFSHLISFSAFTNFLTYFCGIGSAAKTYGSLRTSLDFYLKDQGLKAFFNLMFPRVIIANSTAAIKEGLQHPILSKTSKFVLLQNVIDLRGIQKKSEVATNYEKKCFTTISVGNVRNAKRLDRLVSTFKLIKEDFPDFKIRHIHLGGGETNWLKDLIKSNGVEQYIRVLGPINNVYPYIKTADVLLHFSDIEGASNVIMESMSLSKPVISTNCGDTSLFVKNGYTGYIIHPYDASQFVNSILKLAQNSELYSYMRKNCFEEIEKYDTRHALSFFDQAINYVRNE